MVPFWLLQHISWPKNRFSRKRTTTNDDDNTISYMLLNQQEVSIHVCLFRTLLSMMLVDLSNESMSCVKRFCACVWKCIRVEIRVGRWSLAQRILLARVNHARTCPTNPRPTWVVGMHAQHSSNPCILFLIEQTWEKETVGSFPHTKMIIDAIQKFPSDISTTITKAKAFPVPRLVALLAAFRVLIS